jgi:fimbrial chaperone protein
MIHTMRNLKRGFGAAAVFFVILGFSFSATAASLTVSPIRVVLDGKNHCAVVTLRNTGQEARVVQVELLRWTQEAERDVYTPTRDLLVNPPVFTLAPGQSQLIRVGLNRSPDAAQELAYRLYIQEVPPPSRPGFTGLQMALRIGVLRGSEIFK